MKAHLSDRFIEKITSTGKKQTFSDSSVRYLSVIVSPAGAKCWYYVRKISGHVNFVRLGDCSSIKYQAAATMVADLNTKIAAGQFDNSNRQNISLGELFDLYIDARRNKRGESRSLNISISRFKRFVPPKFQQKSIFELKRKDFQDLLFLCANDGKQRTSNLLLVDIRAAINYAMRMEIIELTRNPADRLDMFQNVERTRFLHADEMKRFFSTLKEAESENFRDVVLLALFTGKRKSNVTGMRWSWIDWRERTLTIPASEVKTRHEDITTLDDLAIEILQHRRQVADRSDFVFSSSDAASGHYDISHHNWDAFRRRANIPDLRIHDLRRTLASWMAGNSESMRMIADALGQTSTAATHIYARIATDKRRRAVSSAVHDIAVAGGIVEEKADLQRELARLLELHPDCVAAALDAVKAKIRCVAAKPDDRRETPIFV